MGVTLTIQSAQNRLSKGEAGTGFRPAARVLFVIDTLEVGGAEQSLLELVTRFRYLQPVVCHVYAGEALKPQFIARDIRVHSIGLKKKYGFAQAYRRLLTVVKTESPDLVVACLTRSELLSRVIGRRLRIPVVGTFVSDLYGSSYNRSLSRKARWGVALFKKLNQLTAGYCTGFIANSEAIRLANATQLGIAPARIQVINRGRDSQRFRYRPRIIVPGKTVHFLHVGRLVPVKGQRDLLHAFKASLEHYPNAALHIAGEGPERQSLMQLIEELRLSDHVQLLGNRTDIPRLLQEYDCFVFPSYSEGFSGAVVEAMLSGVPVLASDIDANREVLQPGVTGYLFASGSVPAMVEAFRWFHANRADALVMASAAHAYAIQHFELDQITAQFETYLQTLIANIS